MESLTSFSRYPLPANSTYVSRSTCEPPTRATSDTEGPTTLRSSPRTAASRLASLLYLLSTTTHTLRNVSRSHVRTKTRVASNTSLNSTLKWPHDFVQFATRNNIRGYTPFSKLDFKQDISNENLENIRKFLERIRNFLEPKRIPYGKYTDTFQYFIGRPTDFDVHAARGERRMHPQLLHELTAPNQSQNIQQGQKVGQDGQLWVENTSVIRE